jgi:hypothetical protein
MRATGCTSRHRVMTSVPIISGSVILIANYCYGSNHHFYRWMGICPNGRDNRMFIKAVLIPGRLKTISSLLNSSADRNNNTWQTDRSDLACCYSVTEMHVLLASHDNEVPGSQPSSKVSSPDCSTW